MPRSLIYVAAICQSGRQLGLNRRAARCVAATALAAPEESAPHRGAGLLRGLLPLRLHDALHDPGGAIVLRLEVLL